MWPPNGLKWPQNAFLGHLGSFWGHLGRFPPHFGGSPPGAGRTLRSPGSGWEAPPWNPHLSCAAIAKARRLGAGRLSGQIVAPMDSTSSRSIKRVYVVPTRSRGRSEVFSARRKLPPQSTGPVWLECPKSPKNDQNDVKIEFFFNFSKWSKMDKSGLQMV